MNLNLIKIFKKKNTKGFTLMEVIIALFIFAVGIIAIYVMTTFTISSTIHVSNKFTAAYLVQEGIELVRNIRDTNWLQGTGHTWNEQLATFNCNGTCDEVINGCIVDYKHSYSPLTPEDPDLPAYNGQFLNIDSDVFYSYSAGSQTKFKRKVSIDASTADILKVCVRVEWKEKGNPNQITAQENLYNWR
jgi:prepilin-type N-terminal cleavage/methylation domain-containing protein